jgi:hypothetical protein
MAKVVLNVTVNGGVPPVSIQTRLFLPNNTHQNLEFPSSFLQPFDNLVTGNYDLYITGKNPQLGNTKSTLTLDPGITMTPPDPSPCTSNGDTYVVEFHFNVP